MMADLLKDAVVAAVRDSLLSERLHTILESATETDVEVRSIAPREVQIQVKPQQGQSRWFLVTIKEQM